MFKNIIYYVYMQLWQEFKPRSENVTLNLVKEVEAKVTFLYNREIHIIKTIKDKEIRTKAATILFNID